MLTLRWWRGCRGHSGEKETLTRRYQAVKEFSKTRLRKRAQSNILRRGPRRPPRFRPGARDHVGPGINATISSQLSDQKAEEEKDSLFLIREEIAIMKKLNHPNLVQLIEVLDDPEEDSLYMVLEMCKKGVIMKVGLDESAQPYGDEECRCWFRDLILGIEYLHAQGVVHRDIKPDNLLLTDDDILKISDFGVSEMFEKPEHMRTAKSAGSPAFLPPELCVAKHGDVSGTAADIWSMGVTLYCLRYGRIPFNRPGVLEMYEAVKTDTPELPDDEHPHFQDLMMRLMEKDPEQRITMPEIRVSPCIDLPVVRVPSRLRADQVTGTSMGHERRRGSSSERRRKLLRFDGASQRARSQPRLHPANEPSSLCGTRAVIPLRPAPNPSPSPPLLPIGDHYPPQSILMPRHA